MNDVWRAAREYLERGWSVIPTYPDKSPIVVWQKYQHQLASPSRVDRWFRVSDRCVAIVCGAVSGVVIVDIERPGVELYRDLPGTLTAMSQSGGAHWYYQYPGSDINLVRVINSTQKDGDLRSDGQYALAPPSIGANGPYVWMNGEDPAPCPSRFITQPDTSPDLYSCVVEHHEKPYHGNNPSRSERIMSLARAAVNNGQGIAEFRSTVSSDWSGSKLLEKGEYAESYIKQIYDKVASTKRVPSQIVWATVIGVRRMASTGLGRRFRLTILTDDGVEFRQGVTLIDGTERTEALRAVLPDMKSGRRIKIELRKETWRGNEVVRVGRFLEGR